MPSKQYCHPLHQAISAGDLKRIKRLVKLKSIDINKIESVSGTGGCVTPLLLAMMTTYPRNTKLKNQILRLLLSHPDIDVNIYRHDISKASINDISIVNLKKEDGTCLLHSWIEMGELELVGDLVKHPKIDIRDVQNGVVTAIVSEYLQEPANKKLQNEMIKVLFSHPQVTLDIYGRRYICNVLHEIFIRNGELDQVKALIKHPKINTEDVSSGIIIAIEDEYFKNPSNGKVQYDIIKTLMEHPKVDVNLKANGFAPIHVAIAHENAKIVELLLQNREIDVNSVTSDPEYEKSYTPLLLSMQMNNSIKITNMLLKHQNIDLTIEDGNKRNILHHMINSVEDSKDEVQYSVISEVLENNPEMITPDENGHTPIDCAKALPDSFGLMAKVLEKYFQKIDKENTSDSKPSKRRDKMLQEDFKKCCWNCDATDKTLYKCSGCKKAYYCSKECITEDWPVHGGYCIKQNKKKNKKK